MARGWCVPHAQKQKKIGNHGVCCSAASIAASLAASLAARLVPHSPSQICQPCSLLPTLLCSFSHQPRNEKTQNKEKKKQRKTKKNKNHRTTKEKKKEKRNKKTSKNVRKRKQDKTKTIKETHRKTLNKKGQNQENILSKKKENKKGQGDISRNCRNGTTGVSMALTGGRRREVQLHPGFIEDPRRAQERPGRPTQAQTGARRLRNWSGMHGGAVSAPRRTPRNKNWIYRGPSSRPEVS